MKCPKCRSSNVLGQKKGLRVGKGITGVVLGGPVGVAVGQPRKDKIEMHCLSCGHVFAPLP